MTTEFIAIHLDTTFWIVAASIASLLILSAFFSGSETALTAARRGKLHSLADRGSRGASRALKLTERSDQLIGSVLLGNNLVNILATALATSLFTRLLGDSGVALATLVMTVLVLVFAEVLPKTYAIANAERAAQWVSGPISLFVWVFAPAVAAIQILVGWMIRVGGARATDAAGEQEVQDEIAGTIALGHEEGNVQKDDRDRLLGALDLKDRNVEEIMLHRSDIEMIDANADPQTIVLQCIRSPHTRLPVFKDDPENIVGLVHAKDLLPALEKMTRAPDNDPDRFSGFDVMDVAMRPYFVPDKTPLSDQMREFLRSHTHFALVVDEYGALQGLITLEDILEEIVGEIVDEHDVRTGVEAEPDGDGNFIVDGVTAIRDLNRTNDWSLPDVEAVTIAGLVIHEAQMIPTPGQVFSFHGFRFEILDRQQNRITRLKLRPL
ncbi:MAG: HlyC/CorC family transporter [Paracoccaceae bacterium]|nr:HlyC/CorC family transporter [Paracoccaceae bacterium]